MSKMGEQTPEQWAKMKEDWGKIKENFKGEDWSKFKQQFGGGHCGGWNQWHHGKPAWKEARAVIKNQPKDVIELQPGQTQIVELEVFNDTHWPWKPGCTLSLADEQAETELPIEIFNLPVEQDVKGKSPATFQIPLSMANHIVADDNKVYEVRFAFRGPRGHPFGETICLKVKCVLAKPAVSEIDIYKLAIKLHEELQLGNLDACIKAVRENHCDEAEAVKALQQ